MIASVHLADVGRSKALGLLRQNLSPGAVDGLGYAQVTTAATLSARLLPRPEFGRVGLIAMWRDDDALDRFLESHPLAATLARGWHVRMQPTRVFGAWPGLGKLLPREVPMDPHERVAVLTLGRLRLTQTLRFLRASAAAEGLALRDPALIAATGLARPRVMVCTFSLWKTVEDMRAFVRGESEPAHVHATRADTARPFHHESAFLRFRPYRDVGSWDSSGLSSKPASAVSSANGADSTTLG